MIIETDNPFEKVLDRLREKGWMKHNFGTENGPNCIRGAALKKGVPGWDFLIPALTPIIMDQYRDRVWGGIECVASFNDHPDTTFADVERVLEKAAVKWEEERVLRHD